MATTLLLAERDDTAYVLARRIRARHRLAARVLGWRLDRALAHGVSPDSTALLSLRAHRLIGRPARRELARALRAVLDDARCPGRRPSAAVSVSRPSVLACAGAMEELAARLDAPAPVPARGVALAHMLLVDGGSPLYGLGSAHDLERALGEALGALRAR